MDRVIKRYLIGAGISFSGMAAICILLYPEIFRHYEYGVSYFGSVSVTAIPYYLGFALTIMFTILTAKQLWQVNKPLSYSFWSIAACMVGVAITSYSLNHARISHFKFASEQPAPAGCSVL